MTEDITIRPAKPANLADINAIYNYYIAHSTCVWTTQPCSDSERKAWYEEHGQPMPVLVAESNGRIVGWGALGSFRAAYTAAGALEDSIYVRHEFHRRKIGSRLLAALMEAARRMGLSLPFWRTSRRTRRRAFDCTRNSDFRRWRICNKSAQSSINGSMRCIYNYSWQLTNRCRQQPLPLPVAIDL